MDLRWSTDREGELTLEAIRAFVADVTKDLDGGSRYVSELLAALEASSDAQDFMARLEDPARLERFRQDGSVASGGERGRSWVDGETWEDMDPYERILSNLLTGETRMMWGAEGAADYARLGEVLAALEAPRRVLSVPSSTGKEPYSIAIASLLAGLDDARVTGVDRQDAYLRKARTGVLVPHHRDLEHEPARPYMPMSGGRVRMAPEVLERCTFEQGDVLTGELPAAGGFALVSCRNLLGYFRGESLATACRNVFARVRPGGVLLLDPFVTESDEMAGAREVLQEMGFARRWEGLSYFDQGS